MTLDQLRRLNRTYNRALARRRRRMDAHGLDDMSRQARMLEIRLSHAFSDAADQWVSQVERALR
jgi:hypothetical protein